MAKKMILMDPHVFERMMVKPSSSSSSVVEDPTARGVKESSESMRDVLDSELNVYDKQLQYQQHLRDYLRRVDQYRDRPAAKVQLMTRGGIKRKKREEEEKQEVDREGDPTVKDVLESVPKSMRQKAHRLLNRLRSTSGVKWNDRGELEFQGRVVSRSNLTDLVNDVLRQRKHATEPTGWEVFADVLSASNIPQDLVGNRDRWRYMREKLPSTPLKSGKESALDADDDDDDDDDDDIPWQPSTVVKKQEPETPEEYQWNTVKKRETPAQRRRRRRNEEAGALAAPEEEEEEEEEEVSFPATRKKLTWTEMQ